MSSSPAIRSYRNGTKVLRRDGNVFVKVGGEWKAEHRLVAEFRLLNRELMPGEKVFHMDNTIKGEDDYNEKDNLVVIRCRTTKWAKLKKSKVTYVPKENRKPEFAVK